MDIKEYKVSEKFNKTIAVVSDLHDMPEDDVIETLQSVKPDIIVAPGDTFERSEKFRFGIYKNLSRVAILIIGGIISCFKRLLLRKEKPPYQKENGYRFLIEANQIAPVIMSLGNHEKLIEKNDIQFVRKTKTILLDNSDSYFQFHEDGKIKEILFGGLSSNPDYNWLQKFSEEKTYKILLCHHPEYYLNNIANTDMDTFDCIIAGHTHGGQWKLFGHGIYAPGQGLFPKYTSGQFGKLIISAGVSNPTMISRWNNPCEIVVVKI